jgi:hypothetical protein
VISTLTSSTQDILLSGEYLSRNSFTVVYSNVVFQMIDCSLPPPPWDLMIPRNSIGRQSYTYQALVVLLPNSVPLALCSCCTLVYISTAWVCVPTYRRLIFKRRFDNSATFFRPRWWLLCHAQTLPGITWPECQLHSVRGENVNL